MMMEKINDYESMMEKYGATHSVDKRMGCDIDLRTLKENQSVVYGDGETYIWIITERTFNVSTKVTVEKLKALGFQRIPLPDKVLCTAFHRLKGIDILEHGDLFNFGQVYGHDKLSMDCGHITMEMISDKHMVLYGTPLTLSSQSQPE